MTPRGAPAVMGVLNVTPDSFSDGGHHLELHAAVARARQMVVEGAAVIDIGGESTRPGATPVDPAIEERRVVPVVEAVVGMLEEQRAGGGPPGGPAVGVRVSVDTRHGSTARAAVRAGASLINDVSASLWPVAAELGVGWVAMHMVGDPTTMQLAPQYDDVVDEVRRFLDARAAEAEGAGVAEVWVDPGIGFGKTTAHNVALLAHLDGLVADGRPVLLATSTKRTCGILVARSDAGLPPRPDPSRGAAGYDDVAPVPVEDRTEGSLSTASWAMIQGVRMIRAHDVRSTQGAATVIAGGGAGMVPPLAGESSAGR